MRALELGENTATRTSGLARFASGWFLAGVFAAAGACSGAIGSGSSGGASPGSGATGQSAGAAGSGGASTPGTPGGGGTTTGAGTANATGTGTGAGGGGSFMPACNGTTNAGPSPVRRMNGSEYDNTVRDLMHVTKIYSNTFPADNSSAGFSNNSSNLTTDILLAQGYQSAAEEMAANALSNLAALAPACNQTSTGAATCAKNFIQDFGKKAFRRPLTNDEVTRYQAIYTTGSTGYTYNDGISLVIEAMLQSPNFLYRPEFGTASSTPNLVTLTAYEMASRLSYFVWQSMPDDMLMAAADANQLSTPDQLTAQVTRMLQDNRAKQMVTQFHREWLFLFDVLAQGIKTAPDWNAQLQTDIVTEADTFVNQVFWNEGKLSSLFTAPYSYLNANVAKHYGVPAPSGTGFVKVNLDPTQRSGFLTLGAFMAGQAKTDQSSPILRGKFVRDQLLCDPIPPPPNGLVIPPIPAASPNSTTRERYNTHDSVAPCSSCHVNMDPIGFLFENYDAVGVWRTTDSGKPVDASGQINNPKDPSLAGNLSGVIDLGKKLAQSPEAASCLATQWFRWGLGRLEGQKGEDACSLDAINKQFQAASYDMRTLPLAVVSTDAFRYRQAGGAQ